MLTPCCWPRRRDFSQSDSDLAELARLMRLKAVDRDTHHTWAKHLWALLAAPPIASVGEEQEVAIGLQRDTEIHSEKNLVLTAVSKPQQPVMSCVCAPTVYGGEAVALGMLPPTNAMGALSDGMSEATVSERGGATQRCVRSTASAGCRPSQVSARLNACRETSSRCGSSQLRAASNVVGDRKAGAMRGPWTSCPRAAQQHR